MFYLVKVSQIARATSGRLQTKFYDKYDDFIFPIVILPHLSTNITVAPAYRIYISQLICYSRVCAQCIAFLDRARLLTQKLLQQDYVVPRLKTSLQICYVRHHELVGRYLISFLK